MWSEWAGTWWKKLVAKDLGKHTKHVADNNVFNISDLSDVENADKVKLV